MVNLNAKQRRYLTDHRHALLGLLSLEIEKTEMEKEISGLEKNLSLYGLTSSGVVPFETVILFRSSADSQKEAVHCA